MKNLVVLIILILFTGSYCARAQERQLPKAQGVTGSLLAVSSGQWIADSLKIETWGQKLKNKVSLNFAEDSLSYKRKIDSLQNLSLSTEKYTAKLDSITKKKEALIGEIQQKQDNLLAKQRSKVQEWQGKIKSKVNLDSLSMSSGLKIPNADLSAISNQIPGDALGGLDIPEMPALSTGELQGINLSPDLSSLNQTLSFEEFDLFNDFQGNLEGLKELQGKLGGISQDVSNIANITKDTDKAIESAVNRLDDVKAVKDQIQLAEGIQNNELVEKAKLLQDPNAIKQEAIQQVTNKAIDHFAGKEQVLQEAMNTLAKYKQKYSSVSSIKDLPKKAPNAMHGKPFIERLVPGIAFQIHRNDDLLIDFNPFIGYRLSGRLTSGIGWNQRVAFVKWNRFNPTNRVYGPRVYSEFKAWKGFSPRIELEIMNTYVQSVLDPSDEGHREWVPGVMVGLKKEYRFLKYVKGTAYVMFNLFDPHHKSPYGDVVNSRFGFEFPIKKKQEKKQEIAK